MPVTPYDDSPSPDPRARTRRQLDRLVEQAEAAIEATSAPVVAPSKVETFKAFELPDLAADGFSERRVEPPLAEVELRMVFGRTRVTLEMALSLGDGSTLVLDQASSDLADLYADGKLIARGEVLLIEDRYAVRIVELLNPVDRVAA
ncbi:MAG TPA: FliM/FliN family flagellar motor switch protein [Pirellulales bacterium]|nr:FliM/FliN family flagellar motor switch protein [Pirellulales bacterium]